MTRGKRGEGAKGNDYKRRRDLDGMGMGGRGRGETKGWHGKYVSRSTHDCTTAYARGLASEDCRSGEWPETGAKFEFSFRGGRDIITQPLL